MHATPLDLSAAFELTSVLAPLPPSLVLAVSGLVMLLAAPFLRRK